jgi:hypothetical protein
MLLHKAEMACGIVFVRGVDNNNSPALLDKNHKAGDYFL